MTTFMFFFFNYPATPEIYPLSLHYALPILTAAHRVINRVHHHAADMRATSLPTRASSFATGDIHVIDIADLADGGETVRSEERRVGKECRSRWSPYH